MDSSDWSNGIRYHITDTRPDTEFKLTSPPTQFPHHSSRGLANGDFLPVGITCHSLANEVTLVVTCGYVWSRISPGFLKRFSNTCVDLVYCQNSSGFYQKQSSHIYGGDLLPFWKLNYSASADELTQEKG